MKTDTSYNHPRLKAIRHLALDMDGTIYSGSSLFPSTIGFLDSLKRNGISYSFLTNNPSKSITDYLLHLGKMGIRATGEEIYTSALAAIDYLRFNHPAIGRLFILGTPSMIGEFEEAGFISTGDNPEDTPDAVVAGFDMTLTYSRLCRAAWWIGKGLPYIATNPDRVCPTDQPIVLVDCGSICACLKEATGRAPDVVTGKPDARMLQGIMRRHGLQPHEIAMVGDRLYTDIEMARRTNALGVLVLTGETKEEDIAPHGASPDIIVKDLTELEKLLLS